MAKKAYVTLAFIGFGLGGLTLSLPSCSKAPNWSEHEWTRESDGPIPHPPSLSEDKLNARIGLQSLEFNEQAIAGVPIQGSYIKTLGKNGEPVWAKAKYLDAEQLPTAQMVREEMRKKPRALEREPAIQKKLGCKFTGEASPELRWKRSWTLVFKHTCENAMGQAFEVVISSGGRMLSHGPAGAGMTVADQSAILYPRGPKLSALSSVMLSLSATPNYLVNPNLEVTSDAGLKFADLAQVAHTTPSDEQFDMLQAYYYSSKALDWVTLHLKFQLSGLKLRTQVGFPNKSNVAFYFNHEVRIGAGDDITFSHMAWDPSIVTHESMHAVVEALTHLPLGAGEGGSLQEAFADILTAMQLDDPQMGEAAYKAGPYQRTLNNQSTFSEKNGGLYHDSLILSGTLWDVRQNVDPHTAEDIVIYLLAHLVPSSGFADVRSQLQAWVASSAGNPKASHAEAIFHSRGWL